MSTGYVQHFQQLMTAKFQKSIPPPLPNVAILAQSHCKMASSRDEPPGYVDGLDVFGSFVVGQGLVDSKSNSKGHGNSTGRGV